MFICDWRDNRRAWIKIVDDGETFRMLHASFEEYKGIKRRITKAKFVLQGFVELNL